MPSPTMQTRRVVGWIYSFHSAFSLFLALFPVCRAVLVNRTIDSFYGDTLTGFIPQYRSPVHTWDDQTCSGCYIQPDTKLAFDGTWMAATYRPEYQNVGFTLEFTGIAIYVFFILPNANGHGTDIRTDTRCNFTLDGQNAGSFSHDPDLSTFDLEYNATVFSRTGLTNTSHQLIVLVNDYPNLTFIIFDWAIYTVDLTESPSTNTTSSSTSTQSPSTSTGSSASHSASQRTGVIVGCVLGIFAVVAIAILLFHIRRLRRSLQLYHGMTPGGILEVGNFSRESPRVESHYRNPSDSDNYYLASASGAVVDYGRPHPNRGNVGEVPAMRQVEANERFRSLPNQDSRGEVRAMRQMEISNHLRAARHEMTATQREIDQLTDSDRGPTPSPSQREIASLRNRVQELSNRIEHLQGQRQSDRGLGEQPPAYE